MLKRDPLMFCPLSCTYMWQNSVKKYIQIEFQKNSYHKRKIGLCHPENIHAHSWASEIGFGSEKYGPGARKEDEFFYFGLSLD